MDWPFRARAAVLVAREHRDTCGSRPKKSRPSLPIAARAFRSFRQSSSEGWGIGSVWSRNRAATAFSGTRRPDAPSTRRGRFSVRPGHSGRKTSSRRKIGSTFDLSARGPATAVCTRSKRSSHQFPELKMSEEIESGQHSELVARALANDLRSLYEQIDREVALIGPVCELSGRCCRFLEYGHTLFVSMAEVEYLLELAPPPVRPLDEGASCPWQDSRGHCTARDARPLGCRIYHCDPTFQEEAHRLSEQFIRRMKKLSSNYAISWNYAPLHRHLQDEQQQGRFPRNPS
jgi:Fe-S-cluster containining protein